MRMQNIALRQYTDATTEVRLDGLQVLSGEHAKMPKYVVIADFQLFTEVAGNFIGLTSKVALLVSKLA